MASNPALKAAIERARETGHALLSPSKAATWMNCSGSIYMEQEYEDTSNIYADLGSDKHELSAICLRKNTDPANYEGRIMHFGNEVNEQFIEEVRYYVETVRRYAVDADAVFIERLVPSTMSNVIPEQGGTADAVIIKDDTLTLIDAKFGFIKVPAEENPQLLTYAEGLLLELEQMLDIRIRKVVLVIVQPDHDIIDEWETNYSRVIAHREQITLAAKLVAESFRTGKPQLTAGAKQCQWCKAKADCDAARQLTFDTVANKFVDLDAEDAEIETALKNGVKIAPQFNMRKLSQSYAMLNYIDEWAKAVRERLFRRMQEGEDGIDWKLVAGRKGNRKFIDEEEAEKILRGARMKEDDIFKKTLHSPTQLEKQLKKSKPKVWKKLNDLVVQSPGAPTIAPKGDPRPELKATKDKFDDLDADSIC